MSLFRHSAKNFWIFFKKILCRVPRRGTRQRIFFLKKLCRVPCPWHSAKTSRMHYISQAHAYLINPLKIHHKCTKVQHHKFIITSSTSLLRRRRLQVWLPGQQWRIGLRRRVDAISRRWHGSGIVWTRWRRLHKREDIACVRLKIKNIGSTSPARGGFLPARNNGTKADNHNGTKADNPNGTKAENHNGTKADNPNGTNALNFHTHRSEVSNRSWSWQLHLDTRCLPDGLHDLIHVRHLLLRGLQLCGQVL